MRTKHAGKTRVGLRSNLGCYTYRNQEAQVGEVSRQLEKVCKNLELEGSELAPRFVTRFGFSKNGSFGSAEF